MTTLLSYQTTELSDEIDPCEKSRLGASPLGTWETTNLNQRDRNHDRDQSPRTGFAPAISGCVINDAKLASLSLKSGGHSVYLKV